MLPFTLQQLQILKAVATEKNLTKAAKLVYLSQPSLSKQLKKLERNLDMLLIHRKNSTISLTENGKIFLQYSERILALCEESCRALIDLKNGERGTLRIGTSKTVGTYFLPRILTLFPQNSPKINFKVQINTLRTISKNILNQNIDIAIVDGEIPDSLNKNLKIEHFVEDEFRLIIPKSHPFSRKKKISKDDLYYLNFIALNSNSTNEKFLKTRLSQNQIELKKLKVIMQLNSIEAIKTAVSLGLGAAFLPSSSIEKEVQLKTIETLIIENISITRPIFILNKSECYKSRAFHFFYTELFRLKHSLENSKVTKKELTV